MGCPANDVDSVAITCTINSFNTLIPFCYPRRLTADDEQANQIGEAIMNIKTKTNHLANLQLR